MTRLSFLSLLLAAPVLATTVALPSDAPTAGKALDEAFLAGGSPPYRTSADQDGVHEFWYAVPGLPTSISLGGVEGPALSEGQGNGWVGTALFDSLDLEPRAGLGGSPWLELRPAPLLPDTPRTRITFYRGAVGAYRFGLDLERRLTSSIGLRVAVQTRAYPSRSWAYSDQVNSTFITSSRSIDSLPNHGITPGLDDMRWEVALGTALPGGHLDGGWRMIDSRRGYPAPLSDTATFPPQGEQSSQEGFLRWSSARPSWSTEGGFSVAALDINRPQWQTDTLGTRWSSFSGIQTQGAGGIFWKGETWKIGPEVLFLAHQGTRDSVANWSEWARREGLRGTWGLSNLALEATGGATSAEVGDSQYGILWDGSAQAGWTSPLGGAEFSASRTHRIPMLTETVLGDPATRWFPSQNLVPEHTTLYQATLHATPWHFLQLDGSATRIVIEDRLAPSALDKGSLSEDTATLQLGNMSGQSDGYSLRGGLRIALGGWQLRGEIARSWMRDPEGDLDLSLPRLWYRAILDWQGRVLHGNMLLGARISLKSTSDYQVWVPVSLKGGANDVSTTERILLPAATLIDLETRFEIGRFGLYWNVLNLGDKRIVPTAGWKALGIQSGFGIHWALSG